MALVVARGRQQKPAESRMKHANAMLGDQSDTAKIRGPLTPRGVNSWRYRAKTLAISKLLVIIESAESLDMQTWAETAGAVRIRPFPPEYAGEHLADIRSSKGRRE